MQIASFKQFRISLLDDWSAIKDSDSTSEFLRITNCAHSGYFRLTSVDLQGVTASDWIEFANHANRTKTRTVSPIVFGQLEGYEVEFVSREDWIRGWVLEYQGIPLDACYRCDLKARGRDDAEVNTMLNSLQIQKETEQGGEGDAEEAV